MAEEEDKPERDELAESLDDLFANLSTMIKGELQGTNNLLELLEKMNLRVAEEYKGFGDVASGLRVFVEQLKSKSGSFDEYVQQIDAIEQQVTEFEAVISMLNKYVCTLESKASAVFNVQSGEMTCYIRPRLFNLPFVWGHLIPILWTVMIVQSLPPICVGSSILKTVKRVY